MLVLIAIDDPRVRAALAAGLRNDAFDVMTVAAHWTDAPDTIETVRPDVLVLELRPGEMDVLRRDREHREGMADTRVLALTSATESGPTSAAVACVPKSLALNDLTDTIRMLLRSSRARAGEAGKRTASTLHIPMLYRVR